MYVIGSSSGGRGVPRTKRSGCACHALRRTDCRAFRRSKLGQGERLPGSAAQCRCDGAERYTEALAGGRVYTKTNRRDPDADDADAPL
jgi:hypothetical protein